MITIMTSFFRHHPLVCRLFITQR